jgi:rRNA maturation protein Nop10
MDKFGTNKGISLNKRFKIADKYIKERVTKKDLGQGNIGRRKKS